VVLEAAEARLQALPEYGPGGLPIGAQIPPFEATTADGAPFTEADLRGRTSLVLFLSSGCSPCRTLADDLNGNTDALGPDLLVVLNDPSELLELGLADEIPILYQPDSVVSRAFDTTATPHAFVVDHQGVVTASGTPNSLRQLRQLVHEGMKGGDRLETPLEKVQV
jgi:thiol-disulfide isomerase/thioredoxin